MIVLFTKKIWVTITTYIDIIRKKKERYNDKISNVLSNLQD